MRRTNDLHADAREIALKADSLNCSNAHITATLIAWNVVWAFWIFDLRLSNENVEKQNAFKEYSWKIVKSNSHSEIHIFDFTRQKYR